MFAESRDGLAAPKCDNGALLSDGEDTEDIDQLDAQHSA